MLRTGLLTLCLLIQLSIYSNDNSFLATAPAEMAEVQGRVTDINGKGLELVDIVAVKNGNQVSFAQTDAMGTYALLLPAGTYTLYFMKFGLQTDTVEPYSISAGELKFLDRTMVEPGVTLPIFVYEYKEPVIDIGGKDPIFKVRRDVLEKKPSKTWKDAISGAPTVYMQDDGSSIQLGGSRPNSNLVVVDGVPCYGDCSNISTEAIEEISVSLTGVSAKYGDFTGGVIEITTRSF